MRLMSHKHQHLSPGGVFRQQCPAVRNPVTHTWGPDEVTFQDWQDLAKAREKKGFRKIELGQNRKPWARSWVIIYGSTPTASTRKAPRKLAEAINSMFAWCRDAHVCYAFLSDVTEADDPGRGVQQGDAASQALPKPVIHARLDSPGTPRPPPRQVLFFSREYRPARDETRDYAILLLEAMPNRGIDETGYNIQIEAIPKHNKSTAGFLKMKKFQIAGPPEQNLPSTSPGTAFHAREVHGAMIRTSTALLGSRGGPICCVSGVLISEDGATKWFFKSLGPVSGGGATVQ
ncbi:Vegetative incompatibility protein HET-E-1 [Colletotrichum sidae]|uniref:Vegetative incompatibility protein HET-E-1 n=1 Tax=Colletotrichum sidae TaxID=1347389 RepID=A0A4R8T9I8_9PEZI|nr:Vegetative incompatibility protein HET-E-1 [Colletotrichum sidae]